MSQYTHYRMFAEKLVKFGGEVALQDFQKQKFKTRWKADKSYVTQTDTTIESKFRTMIATEFPEHAIFGEEYGGTLNSNQPTWVLDPLDGTTNFSHHIPLFCSMAALQIDNKIVAAAISSPIQGFIYSASLGDGATINGEPFPQLSNQQDLAKITLLADSGKSEKARADSYHFLSLYGNRFRSFRKFGCMIAPLLYATHSKLDAVIIFGVDLYDIAGLSLIFHEAGYTTMGTSGKRWQQSENSDFIVTTQLLQSKIESILVTFTESHL